MLTKSFIKNFVISQLFGICIITIFLVTGVMSSFIKYYSIKELVIGFCLFELWAGISCLFIDMEKKIIRDEREQLIELKSAVVNFKILMLGMAAYLFFDYFAMGNANKSNPILWFIILGSILNGITVQLYRKII